MALLNSHKDKILCVKGNCDAEVDEMVLEFPLFPEATIKLNNHDEVLFVDSKDLYNYQFQKADKDILDILNKEDCE